MLSLAVKAFLSIVLANVVWRTIRRFVLLHPLDILPGPASDSFWRGNMSQLFEPDAWDFHRSLAETYGSVIRVFGPLKDRILYVYDPKALHHIFVKDQHIFEESDAFIAGNKAIFGDGLLSTMGDHHRKQRKMLNPVFSIAHMRNMIPTFFKVTYKLRDVLDRQTADGPKEVEMVGWVTRVALEIIGQSGLGTSFDPITDDHVEHEYITSVKLLGPLARPLIILRFFFVGSIHKYKLGTPRIWRFLADTVPWTALHKMMDITDLMHNTSVVLFNSRKKELADGKNKLGDKKDLISILMRENAKAADEDRLPDNEVLAQISTFMFAAMDTTSSALSRILWLMATHQDVQDKLRSEIREAKAQYGEPTYDQLESLKYLDAVCRETLRVYCPINTISRETHSDAILPLSKPIKTVNGKEVQEIHVPKYTLVLSSIRASNTNPELWGPDAYEWKPERWLSPLPDAVLEARIPGVYSHLMTFVGGSRSCIGFKFSQMEMKVVLFILIDRFKFSLTKQPVYWNMVGITTPSIDRSVLRPKLPLVVSRVD